MAWNEHVILMTIMIAFFLGMGMKLINSCPAIPAEQVGTCLHFAFCRYTTSLHWSILSAAINVCVGLVACHLLVSCHFRLQVYECHKHLFIPERLKESVTETTHDDSITEEDQQEVYLIRRTYTLIKWRWALFK